MWQKWRLKKIKKINKRKKPSEVGSLRIKALWGSHSKNKRISASEVGAKVAAQKNKKNPAQVGAKNKRKKKQVDFKNNS